MSDGVRIAAVLSPATDWPAILAASRESDRSGLDAIGLWDHYHSGRPDWGYIAGWSALGAIAVATERVRVVPMVLNNLHYQVGVLAKESSTLSIASAGRFELGIGAGDWPESFAAWGERFPAREERLARLAHTIAALRQAWTGDPVTYSSGSIRLEGAISTPPPPLAPRVVVGVGRSSEAARRLAPLADELNVYLEPEVIDASREAAEATGRPVSLSGFVDWSWDRWPADVEGEIARHARSVDRLFVSIGSAEMERRVSALAEAASRA